MQSLLSQCSVFSNGRQVVSLMGNRMNLTQRSANHRFCYKQKLTTRLITKKRNTDFIVMQKQRRGSSGIFSQRHAEAADKDLGGTFEAPSLGERGFVEWPLGVRGDHGYTPGHKISKDAQTWAQEVKFGQTLPSKERKKG